jgi:hypothetical protein
VEEEVRELNPSPKAVAGHSLLIPSKIILLPLIWSARGVGGEREEDLVQWGAEGH